MKTRYKSRSEMLGYCFEKIYIIFMISFIILFMPFSTYMIIRELRHPTPINNYNPNLQSDI